VNGYNVRKRLPIATAWHVLNDCRRTDGVDLIKVQEVSRDGKRWAQAPCVTAGDLTDADKGNRQTQIQAAI
jgi:hypothetical protein